MALDRRRLSRIETRLVYLFLTVVSLLAVNNMLSSRSRSIVDEVILHLKNLNINLLAIDFDQTLIDIHTGGRWCVFLRLFPTSKSITFQAFLAYLK
jgi:hypothetical protein